MSLDADIRHRQHLEKCCAWINAYWHARGHHAGARLAQIDESSVARARLHASGYRGLEITSKLINGWPGGRMPKDYATRGKS